MSNTTPVIDRDIPVPTARLSNLPVIHREHQNKTLCGLPISLIWIKITRPRKEITCPVCKEIGL